MRFLNDILNLGRRAAKIVFLSIFLGCSTGCSSFHRDWRSTSVPSVPNDATGPWEGTWKSEANGHEGKLRCLMSVGGPTGHRARFRATYASILTFEYTVPLELKSQGDSQTIQGEANLGWLAGGTYHYDGFVSTNEFLARYTSKADHGVFHLHRPSPSAGH